MGFQITGLPEADAVLDEYPLAIVIGMQLDQQYGIEHAFRGGWKILSRFGSLDTAAIAAADPAEFTALCKVPPAIHRFPGAMAQRVQELARVVTEGYGGDASRIWSGAGDTADLKKRIGALPGFGDMKIKSLGAVLAKRFGVEVADDLVPIHPTLGDVDSLQALSRSGWLVAQRIWPPSRPRPASGRSRC